MYSQELNQLSDEPAIALCPNYSASSWTIILCVVGSQALWSIPREEEEVYRIASSLHHTPPKTYQSHLWSNKFLQIVPTLGYFSPMLYTVSNKLSETDWYFGGIWLVLELVTFAVNEEFCSEKPKNCPKRERQFHFGIFWSFYSLGYSTKTGHPQTFDMLKSRWSALFLVSNSSGVVPEC